MTFCEIGFSASLIKDRHHICLISVQKQPVLTEKTSRLVKILKRCKTTHIDIYGALWWP